MSEELKPCPFCGSEAKEIIRDNASLVYCNKCERGTGLCKGADSARKLWNTRPIEDGKDKEIVRLKRALYNLKDDVIRRRMFATTVEEKMFLDETRCHLEAELDYPADNNVGSMEE